MFLKLIRLKIERNELTCWFTENPESIRMDQIAIVLRNANLILYCMSDNFTANPQCCEIFNYSRNLLNKPHLLVVLGNSLEWQKTNIGAMVTDELFIKVNTIARYDTSLPDMIELAKKKIESVQLLTKKTLKNKTKDIFLRYEINNFFLIFINIFKLNSNPGTIKF